MENMNQPAFPDPLRGSVQSYINQTPEKEPMGLTKRELIAAMALQGLMAVPEKGYDNIDECIRDGASIAVKAADALLTELSKPQP